MKKSIKSSVIGEWKSETYPFDNWASNVIAIPFLDNQELEISLDVNTYDKAIELAIKADNITEAFPKKNVRIEMSCHKLSTDNAKVFLR